MSDPIRTVLGHTPELMLVSFAFEAGDEGKLHHHPHAQSTFVRSGRFRFSVDGAEREIGPGDTVMIPPNAVHGCLCLEAGELIDSFAPRRDDFL